MNQTFKNENEDKWFKEVYRGNSMIELSIKVFIVGALLSILLISSNIYLGLKTGMTIGGSFTAAVLGFVFIKAFKGKLTILENNNIQTMASAAASLGVMVSAIPALILLGYSFTWYELLIWVFVANILGVIFTIPLRKQFIAIEKLTFPSGTACAATLEAMHTTKNSDSTKKGKWLAITGLFAAIFTWFRDGIPAIIPSLSFFPGKISNYALARLTAGAYWSPMLFGIGFLVGPRIGISLLLGSLIGWIILGPILANANIISGVGYRVILNWTMWSAIALMVTSGITSFIINGGAISRTFKSMKEVKLGKSSSLEFSFNLWMIIFLVCVIVVAIVMQVVFLIPFWMTLIAVIISFLFSLIAARAYGETDMSPAGAMGYATQIIYGGISPGNMITNVMAAGVAASGANQASDMMQDFKTGYLLGATPKKQTYAQFAGVAVGAIFAVPIFYALINAYGLASANLPAPGAQGWSGMAKVLSQGFSFLPAYADIGIICGAILGILLALLERTKIKKYVPSPFGLGIGMFFPAFFSVSIFLGSVVKFILEKIFPKWMEEYSISVASGAIIGEGILGVVIAVLMFFGVI